MRQIFVILVACFLSAGAYAQQTGTASAVDQATTDALKKDKEKSDKDITDAKNGAKASTWMDRAKTYQNMATSGYMNIDSAAATTAMEAYKKVIELDKNKKGESGKLAKEAEEALKSPELYRAYMQQGVAKFQNKNFTDALKSLTMAGDINPADTTAPLYAAIAAQQLKDNATAKTQLEKYIAGGGKDASIYGSLAMLYRSDNEVDKAVATLDKAIALDPKNKDLAAEKVNIMLTNNRMDEAITQMKKLIETDPNNVQNLVNLSIVYNNIARKDDEEIRKLEGQAKKGGTLDKQLADSKSIIDAYNSEIARVSAANKKKPSAELKRQLSDVQKRLTEQKTELASLEAQAKEAAAGASAAAENEKKVADMKKKQDEYLALENQYLEKALAVDPNNYDANYNKGVYIFNQAVLMKNSVDKMSMAEYTKAGKEADGKVCGKFKQALPYFMKAKSVKEEPELLDNLEKAQTVLKQYEEKKVECIEPTK